VYDSCDPYYLLSKVDGQTFDPLKAVTDVSRFLWVKLQLQNLCDKRMKIETDVRKELGHLPPGIKQLYENIFLQLEGSAEGSRSSAEAVLKWLLCARRPLSMKALIEAVSPVEDEKLILLTKEEVSLICCNLVVADEETDTFRLAHLSVQEFLEKKPAYQGSQLHAFATQRCIEDFVGPRQSLRSTEAPSADGAQSFHAYAVAHWEYHFACVEIKDRSEELSKQIKDFLLDEDSFAAFNSEALESAERREYHSFPYESLGYLSQKPTPIFTVCRFGLPDVLEDLDDEEVDWNQTNIRNDAPLHLAAVYGNEDVVKFLLDRDEVQPDKKGEWGYTPLMVACGEGMKPISTWLIEKDDVDVNMKDDIGQSALHHAAYEGRDACIDLLLEHNAGKDAKDEEGRTPLYEAARTGQKTAVRRLLKAKADATATDINGKTLLIAAIEGGKNQFEDVVQMLLKTDVDIQAQDDVGASALHFAAMQGQDRIVEVLVKKKAPISAKDHKGKTPLDYASRANNKKIIKFLLNHGATCEPDLEGRTELHEVRNPLFSFGPRTNGLTSHV
jgi:ankyrin repeat protein